MARVATLLNPRGVATISHKYSLKSAKLVQLADEELANARNAKNA
jgi:hypothetical protein